MSLAPNWLARVIVMSLSRWIDLVPLASRSGASFRIQRPDPHLTHQPLYALTIDLLPGCIELVANTTAAVERKLKMDLIDQAHQREVFFTDR